MSPASSPARRAAQAAETKPPWLAPIRYMRSGSAKSQARAASSTASRSRSSVSTVISVVGTPPLQWAPPPRKSKVSRWQPYSPSGRAYFAPRAWVQPISCEKMMSGLRPGALVRASL